MKIAIITVTNRGKTLGMKILKDCESDHTIIKVDLFHKNVKNTLNNIFNSYNTIIGIMATGIMIRNICPLLTSKETDPAVLVIDENGNNVISLISGHLGGANELSNKIANNIGAKSIITTATDINNKFGIDCLAKKYYLKINDISQIKSINSALINNEKVKLDYNSKFEFIWQDNNVKNTYHKGSNQSNLIKASYGSHEILLIPKKIVVGIGSKKNVNTDSVINAVKSALKILELPIERVNSFATGEMKQNEEGIINAAIKLNIPLEIISEDNLKNFNDPDMISSDFVMEKFGLPGVCEPSSMISAGDDSILILRKTIYNGITVAVSVSKN
jgi:cobalt-precorrin 5A hydrolase